MRLLRDPRVLALGAFFRNGPVLALPNLGLQFRSPQDRSYLHRSCRLGLVISNPEPPKVEWCGTLANAGGLIGIGGEG
jgi:hypothetical protein